MCSRPYLSLSSQDGCREPAAGHPRTAQCGLTIGGTNAGGFARCASTTAEGTGVYNYGGPHAGTGDRSDYGDLYPHSPGDAEIPAGGEAGGAVEDRR